ncbi:unnamed protein product [Boreogadus saida]
MMDDEKVKRKRKANWCQDQLLLRPPFLCQLFLFQLHLLSQLFLSLLFLFQLSLLVHPLALLSLLLLVPVHCWRRN